MSGDAVGLHEWLAWIESFPFVSGWQWTAVSRQRFFDRLRRANIAACLDAYGNVLLGADCVDAWYARLRTTARCCLHAHLDHPGAVVAKTIAANDNATRYSARVQGGIAQQLVGRRFALSDAHGRFVADVVVDHQTTGLSERWISFLCERPFDSPAYLRGPDNNPAHLQGASWQEGWGLDDHVGCATLLDWFAGYATTTDVLGVLTLDEEIGAFGLRHLERAGTTQQLPIAQWPLLLSVEVTAAYPALDFLCGAGPRWRSADRDGALDAAFVQWIAARTKTTALALTHGICEAGLWTRAGGRGACIVVPCRFAHNGLQEQEWRAEQVDRHDLVALQSLFAETIAAWKPRRSRGKRAQKKTTPTPVAPAPEIINHLSLLHDAANDAPDFISALQRVLPAWHQLHAAWGLPLVKITHAEWPAWRSVLLASRPWDERLRPIVTRWASKIQRWCGAAVRADPVQVHLFAGAPFNGCNRRGHIALSIEQLPQTNLARLLVHELTHWWLAPHLRARNFRPAIATAINEGLACLATIELLGLTEAEALGLSSSAYDHLCSAEPQLQLYFSQWLEGDLFVVQRGRHTTVTCQTPPHPFSASESVAWRKFGYFLGLRAVRDVFDRHDRNWAQWLDTVATDVVEQQFQHRANDPVENLRIVC